MIAFLFLQIGIVPEQLIQACARGIRMGKLNRFCIANEQRNCSLTAAEREQHQRIDEKEFDDIDYHAAQWDLQRPQMRIYREYVHQFQKWENHASRKNTLGQ